MPGRIRPFPPALDPAATWARIRYESENDLARRGDLAVEWLRVSAALCDACTTAPASVRRRARSVVDEAIVIRPPGPGTGGDWILCAACAFALSQGQLEARLTALYGERQVEGANENAARVVALLQRALLDDGGEPFVADAVDYRLDRRDGFAPGTLPPIAAKRDLPGDAHVWIADQHVDVTSFQAFWDAYRLRFGYVIPSARLIDEIVRFADGAGIVELGAGNGYLAALCATALDVIALDTSPTATGFNQYYRAPSARDAAYLAPWHPVKRSNERALAHHADRTLLLSWPPPKDNTASNALGGYAGERVVVIGDVRSCGDPAFWETLRRSWHEALAFDLPSLYGVADRARFYVR